MKKTLVLAGNFAEYAQFLRIEQVRQSDYPYVRNVTMLLGTDGRQFGLRLFGSWRSRELEIRELRKRRFEVPE